MKIAHQNQIPVGTRALILSKYYYGVLSKNLEKTGIERYYSILYFLNDHNGCSQQYICNNLAIDKTAMVKVMDYLTKSGLVERKINPLDRREHFIKLTKKGLKHTEIVVKSFNDLDNEIFVGLNRQERATFEIISDKIIEKLKVLPGNDLFFHYKQTNKKNQRAGQVKKK